jgi:hypothetical protein
MGQANVELVRGVYDAFARGDVDAVFAAMKPDIEWDESEGMPYGGVYHGREEIVTNVSVRSSLTSKASPPIRTRFSRWTIPASLPGAGMEARAQRVRSMPALCISGRLPTVKCRATNNSQTRASSATPLENEALSASM